MGAGYGRVDPTRVPYYLLIVGDPEAIPYSFQYELDVQYAVGRIHFDTAKEYARYARSVVTVEKTKVRLPRKAVFFNVRNDDDLATSLSDTDLVTPLVNWAGGGMKGWTIEPIAPEEARRERLTQLLGGSQTPALLFTASHGLGLNLGDPHQRRRQGSLVCRDWPGPLAWGPNPIPPEHCFSADDVADSASLLGLLTFHFACYGGGTPRLNDFAVADAWRDEGAVAAFKLNNRDPIAPAAFVAQLPRRLLSHPRGGALAVVAHTERAWGYSFSVPGGGSAITDFQSRLTLLADGHPIGSAVEPFNEKFGEYAAGLTKMLEDIKFGLDVSEEVAARLAELWTGNNDARGFTIIGDPAVTLPVGDADPAVARPTIPEIRLTPTAPAASAAAPTTGDAPSAVQAPGLAASAAPPVGYGALGDARAQVLAALQQFATGLSQSLKRVIDDATTLEVTTYTSERLEAVTYAEGKVVGARLRAVTRIRYQGNTLVCVPETDGKVDDAIWSLHKETVKMAQEHHTEIVKTALSSASGLLDLFKGL